MQKLFLLFLTGMWCHFSFAQETSIYTDRDADYKKGLELLQQEKFTAAQEKFRDAIARVNAGADATSHELLINSYYYDAYCSKELNRPDAEKLFNDLVSGFEENPTTRRAYFQLADLYFDQKKYNKALPWYRKVDPADLGEEELTQYNFQFGVSLFYQKDFNKAKKFFEVLKNEQSTYYYPSNYYYGYIAYKEGDLTNALSAFKIAGQSELYKPIIPYYLANIDFMQRDYDAVINDGSLLLSASSPYQLEMQQLIGKAWFEKQQYEKALPYFTAYFNGSKKVSKTDLYQIGFCQYKTRHYDEAINTFLQLNALHDSLGQNALYLLADCYLKTDKKNEARLAYEGASKMSFDPFVKEQSAFLFAKLSHELNYHDVAVKALQKFINEYPKSSHSEEARQYLTLEFLSTNNYQEALEVIRSINNKSVEMRRAYQKVAFAYGTELYNEKKYSEVTSIMDESLKNPVDPGLQAGAYFWKGEASFNLQQNRTSIENHNQFLDLVKPKTVFPANVTVPNSRYTLAYCYLKENDYQKAFHYFSQVKEALASSGNEQNKKIYSDAILRSGDCQFALRNYSSAISNYEVVAAKKLPGSDYALFQKAVIQGLQNDNTSKINTLKRITTEYANSIYTDDALYELGLAHLSIAAYQDASQAFSQIISRYPSGSYAVKAHLKMGLIYFNLNNNEKALEQYQWVLDRYPKSAEGAEALSGVKEIFTEKGDGQGYLNFVKALPNVSVSEAMKDSVTYLAAESKYSKGDCSSSIKEFNSYLSNFPQGKFAIEAHFYRGECLSRQNDFDEALNDYEFVAEQPQNRFSQKALLQAARINYSQKKNYDKSYNYYKQLLANADYKSDALEAAKGMMYSAFYLNRFPDASNAANTILSLSNAGNDDQLEAHFYLGRIAYEAHELDKAFIEFNAVSKSSSAIGAEASYRLAEIHFRKNDLRKAEEQCWTVVKHKSGSNYWVAKSYLLLADIFEAQDDLFQAKATLQSIIDNYKGTDDIMPAAKKKLEQVKSKESSQSKLLNDNEVNKNDTISE